MPDMSMILPMLSLVIALSAAVGVVVAFLGNKNRGLSEVQTSTITALQAQNDAQEQQIKAQGQQIKRLNRVVLTIEYALKRRGLRIEIDDDAITLIDENASKRGTSMQIRLMDHVTGKEEDKEA